MKATIYRLNCGEGFYIGSTTLPLLVRLYLHYNKSKETGQDKRKIYKYIKENGGFDIITMEKIVEIECSNKKDLLIKENEYIEPHLNNPLCLNSCRSSTDRDKINADRRARRKAKAKNISIVSNSNE